MTPPGTCRRWPSMLMSLVVMLLVSGGTRGQQLLLSPGRSEHVVFDGKSLFISCRGRSPIGIVWYDPTQKEIVQRRGPLRVEPSRDQSEGYTGVDLVLNPVRRKDRGKYVCRATVDGLEQETSFTLVVLKPITFKEDQRTQFAAEGSNFTLMCDVTGDPQPEVDWRGYLRHLQLSPTGKFDVDPETSGLIIRNVTREDEGKYICKATQVNSKNSDMRIMEISLKVRYKPQWLSSSKREVFSYVHGRANLSCRAQAEPPPKFHWFRDQDMPLAEPDFNVINTDNMSILEINSVTADMFGVFRCRAQNQIGTIEQTLTLREGQKPAVPTVVIGSVGSSSITLSITTAEAEVPPDEFRAQYKRRDSQWRAANTIQFKPGGPFVLNNLQPGTNYDIRVATRNQAGYGDFSRSVLQETKAAPNPNASSRPMVLEMMLCALIMAALLVL